MPPDSEPPEKPPDDDDLERRARRRASSRAYQQSHKKEIAERERQRRQNPEYLEKRRASGRESRRKQIFKSVYGISTADYEIMAKRQGGLCKLCKRKPANRLAVDHCHATNKVRSLLCLNCNSMLGFSGDDPICLEAGAAYLRDSRGESHTPDEVGQLDLFQPCPDMETGERGPMVALFGRLIRVGNQRSGSDTVYVVAEADPVKAAEIIRANVAGPNGELEDLGRASAKLLETLALRPGQFTSL
jgi:recombination endonuclease VII